MLVEALQAAQGQISRHVRGLCVEAGYELILLHARVDREDADTREDLIEMAQTMEGAMEQYVDPSPSVELRLTVGDTDPSWSGRSHRGLYLMHWRDREGYIPD